MTEAQTEALDEYLVSLKALRAAEKLHQEAQRRAQTALEAFNQSLLGETQ